MEEKQSFEEFNYENDPSGEQNVVEIKNDYDNYYSRANADEQENNYSTLLSKDSSDKKKKNALLLRLLASFLAVCAIVAIVQTSFEIPVFSNLFHPTSTVTSPSAPPPTFTLNALDSTYKDITYTVTIDNADFIKDEYALLVVKSGCDTDEYLNTVPATLKASNKIILNTAISTGSMVKCVTTSGAKSLSANTNYVFLILRNDSIALKKAIQTEDFTYVYGITLTKSGDYVKVEEAINPSFTNYSAIYIEIFHGTTGLYITRAGSSVGGAQYIDKKEFTGVSTVDIKVFLLPTDLTGFEDSDTITVGPDTYYYVYKQINIDIKSHL